MRLVGHAIKRDAQKPLHYYQEDAVRDTEESWSDKGWTRSLIDIPPGGGKSLVTGELCARSIEKGGRTLFLAHSKELVVQPKESFESDFGCSATVEMGELKADESPMVFASVQTMVNRIKKGLWRPDTFQRVILDEAHRTLAEGHSFVAKHFGNEGAMICGCTGTPRRGDKRSLMEFYDGISYEKPIQELFQEGFLIEPTIRMEPLGVVMKHESAGNITDEEVDHAIEPYLEQAADIVIPIAKGRCGLSFLPLRATAKKFCRLLNERGLKAEYIGGDIPRPQQKEIKRRLLLGEIDHVCNAQIWGEGVDIRPCNLLVDLRPCMSWPSAIQKWTRLTRTYDPSKPYAMKGSRWGLKTDAILLDFCFQSEHHSMLIRPAAILARDEDEERRISRMLERNGGGSLMQAVKDATAEREEKLRRRLEAMRSRESRYVTPTELFLSQNRMDLVDYMPMAKWELEEPSSKQIEFLLKQKVAIETITSRGQASKMIDMFMDRRNKGLATGGQVKFLMGLGVSEADAWKMGFAEASDYLDRNAPRKPSWQRR